MAGRQTLQKGQAESMRLGLSSYSYRYAVSDAVSPMDASMMVRRTSALGLDFLQICDNVPLDSLGTSELQNLRAEARDLGLAIEVGARGLDSAYLRRYIDVAAYLGSRSLRLVLGVKDATRAQALLRPVVQWLEEADLMLAVENHFDLRAVELAAVIEALGSDRVRVCLDTANSVGLLERPLETAATLGRYACQVHLKDFVVEKAPIGYQITGRPLGAGWLHVDELLRVLGGRAPELDYAVELWTGPAENREATLAREVRWIEKSVKAAKRLLENNEERTQ